MDGRERGKEQPSPIAKEIDELLSTEDTWRDDLRQQISKRVQEEFRPEIRRKIEKEFEYAQFWRGRQREKRLKQLIEGVAQRKISTGNPDFNIVFVLTGKAEPELVAKVRTLRERVNQALDREENPLLLEIHFLKGEANVLSLTQISQPGLSLWTHESLGHNLGFSATGYASWSKLRASDYSSPSSYYNRTPFHLRILELRETEPGLSFEEAFLKSEQEKSSLSLILLGQDEIESFIKGHPQFQPILSSLHATLSQNSGQEITPLKLPSEPPPTFS